MKKFVFHSTILALLGLILYPPSVAHASSPPADSVHFCAFDDYEQWRRDHPRPAAKRLADSDLNVGEPRTVRMIYFLPNDRSYRAEVVQWMKEDIRKAQTFFAEQMQAHGYGNKTFRFETDAQGEPLVHHVDAQHPESHYYSTVALEEVWQYRHFYELEQAFDFYQNIYVVYSDSDLSWGGAITGGKTWKEGGFVDFRRAEREEDWPDWSVLSHELGHAFGFGHDFRDGAYLMSYGGPSQFPDASYGDRISACAAEFLSVHPYFNSAIPIEDLSPPTIERRRPPNAKNDPPFPIEDLSPPTIELISPTEYPAGLRSVSIKFEVSDSDGLHQALFYSTPGFWGAFFGGGLRECRAFEGERNAVVEFDYDGSRTAAAPGGFPISSLTDPLHLIDLRVVDRDGNMGEMRFDLTKTVPSEDLYTLTKVSGDEQQGPAGTALAEPFVVSVLDQNGSAFAGVVVTFSVTAGGGTLSSTTATTDANGRARSTLTLSSEPGTNTVTATVAGLEPVTFAATAIEQTPHSLTKVSGDSQEGLAGEQLATPFVVSVRDEDGSAIAGAVVSFSVTGGGTLSSTTATTDANGRARSTLTLGSEPGTNTVSATVEGLGTVTFTATTVEQTPHSLTKVSGDGQEGLAGVALAAPFVVSVLDEDDEAIAGVTVTFSVTAGEGILSSTTATTDANGQATTTLTLTLGSELGTNTVSATVEGLEPETFTATSVGQAIPDSLAKVSGDGQEGTVGAVLAEPFVVSVLDEDGAAIAGAVVSFSVTAGGGTLSATTATTDANGQARSRLTLGSDAGTNTVSATVEGLEPGTFTATGQESPFASLFDLFGGGKRVALPDSPQLAQNAPNPFNSQTVLAYFLHAPSPARLEVFALTGQRVAILHQGPQQAGYHRLHWDGRDDAGQPLASGTYLYRLVADEVVLTRKLILLR